LIAASSDAEALAIIDMSLTFLPCDCPEHTGTSAIAFAEPLLKAACFMRRGFE
jgi:hypothetical protein